MKDERVEKLAKLLVRYCVDAQSEEIIAVNTTTEALPLVEELHDELLRVGARPLFKLSTSRMQEGLYQFGKPHHFDSVSQLDRDTARHIAGSMRIEASANTRTLSAVDPKKQVRLTKATKPLREKIIRKKWVVSLFPTEGLAQDADMSLREFENFVYSATFVDQPQPIRAWKALGRKQTKLIQKLEGADEVHITGPGTDLKLSVRNRTFINSAGTHNMPSGEVFTGPVEKSVEGYIEYDYPVCHGGREIEGIRLVFKEGKVVEATADKNQAFLRSMLDLDSGARYLGELGIGTNYGIQRFSKNILYDEKIGGTVHLAVGQSYEETGGRNKSALHWDMIKDLRKGGTLYIDGKVFQKDGKFTGGF